MSYRFCVFFCLILGIMNSNFAIENSGTFQQPTSNITERISLIQNDLLKVQTEILRLTTAVASGGDSLELKTRLSTLEMEFVSLKQQLADEKRESFAANGKYDNAIATLTSYYTTLDNQLIALQLLVENKAQEDAKRRWPTDVIEAIQSHRFAAAETLLLRMPNSEHLPKIVSDVYYKSQGNTDVLVDFANALTKTDLSFYVLKALKYEMQANGHRDPYKLMMLSRALEGRILAHKDCSVEVKIKAEALAIEILGNITAAATETLKTAIYSSNYQRNVKVEALVESLDDFHSDVSDEVMKRIVSETYPSVSAVTLADYMNSNNRVTQKISGLTALFWKLESANDLNNKAVLSIGDYLKRVQGSASYANTSAAKKTQITKVIASMPSCARNLFFAPVVCLWNVGKSGYLYASTKYKWNPDRRRVFTWGPGNPVRQGAWYVEKMGDKFYFKNRHHNNEYLYAAIYKRDGDRRYVMTWVNGGIDSDQYAWDIELNGTYCYIKNLFFNEYLFTSAYEFNRDRKYALTWVPGTSVRQPEFQWEIRGC